MDTFENLTIFISILSIMLAGISVAFSIFNSWKINKLNLRNNYFDILKEDLTLTLPKYCTSFVSDKSLNFNDEIGEEFEKYINEFRVKIKFLYYFDKKNYEKIDSSLVALEEEIILLPTRKENIQKHIDGYNKNIFEIYKNINKHFS